MNMNFVSNGICSGAIMFLRRDSDDPSRAAWRRDRSRWLGPRQIASGRPAPRYGAVGGVLENTPVTRRMDVRRPVDSD